jgi:methylthioxylose transferase
MINSGRKMAVAAAPVGDRRLGDRTVAPAAAGRWRPDILAVTAALALIAAAAVGGRILLNDGRRIVLPAPPLLAHWAPHLGWGTPLTVLCVLVGLRLQQAAAALRWRRLLLTGWLLNLAWMCSLILVDGLQRGWVEVLLEPNEYLHDLPRITDPGGFVATFTHFIAFGPGVDGTMVWTTHVAAHPPLATLLFWALDRIGLGGGFWAGALCIVVGSAVSVAVPVTVRELGAEAAARRAVPLAALFPGAVWMAVSADGLFAGVATSGLALLIIGAAQQRLLSAGIGGLLLGIAIFLSYGLALFGLVVLVACAVVARQCGWRQTLAAVFVAASGVSAVAVAHFALGFNWLVGLQELRVRYYQGIASQRPYAYFVWANVGAWLVSCSPLLAVGIVRGVRVLSRWRHDIWSSDRVVALLGLSGVLAALLADLSGLSKAETERIWLSFGAIAWTTLALVRGRSARWMLLAAAVWAIGVNHLLDTGW